jgi:hypothetical protein
MSDDQWAPWLTDPDDPEDIPTASASAAKNVFATHPELVDKSKDGPHFGALIQAAQDVIDDNTTDPYAKHIIQTFMEAIRILDQSEPQVRDMIENQLFDVAGINKTKVSDAMLTRDELAKKIAAVRHHHIKKAFRHLRAKLPK